MIVDEREQEINHLKEQLSIKDQQLVVREKTIAILEDEIELLKLKLFGRRSEKYSPEEELQASLFNEAELGSTEPEEKQPAIEVAGHTRKRRGHRKPLPESIPRKIILHDIPESAKRCGCGCRMIPCGEEASEKLAIIPGRFYVERHIRLKYACEDKACIESEEGGQAVIIAPPAPALIPKGMATPSLLAFLLTSKYCDSLPFYRMTKILYRMGADISRQTMCRWAITVADALKPLMDLLYEELLNSAYIGIDETRSQVIKEPGREATTLSYTWVYYNGKGGHPVYIYQYRKTRAGGFLKDLLSGFKGYVQCDGYAGYNILKELADIILVYCWAHVRRKFHEALQATKKKTGSSREGLAWVQKLYAVEREADRKNLTPEERKELRAEKSAPILEKFKAWLDKKVLTVAPKTLLGKAVNYTLKLWDGLIRYLDDGRIPIDNNGAENAVRPFALGRKNWLFAYTPAGAEASVILYSIIQTAILNDLEPFWYMNYLLEKLPFAKSREDFLELLPYNVDRKLVAPPGG